jgi:hypothetical protein
MGIRIKGKSLVIKNLKKEIKKIKGKMTRVGMLKAGLLVMERSKELAPKDKGNLRESGFVVIGGEGFPSQAVTTNNFNSEEPEGKRVASEHGAVVGKFKAKKNKNKVFAVIGHSAFYALKEHEAMDEVHDIGHAKFLESAAGQSRRDILKILKESVKR